MWLLSSFLHIFYAERLAAFVATKVPYVEPDYSGTKRPVVKVCKIPRGSMTETQYKIACIAIEKAELAKAEAANGSNAPITDDIESGEDEVDEEDSDEAF